MSHQYNILDKGVRELTIFTSAARTATITSGVYTNRNAANILAMLNITAVTTGNLTFRIFSIDPISGNQFILYQSSGLLGVGTYAYALGNTILSGGTTGLNAGFSSGLTLPKNLQFQLLKGDASSWTFSLSAAVDGSIEAV